MPASNVGDSSQTACIKQEEGGDDVKSVWPLRLGLHTYYNAQYNVNRYRKVEEILKTGLSSDCGLQLAHMKLESLVMAHQLRCREYVPGSCTHRPSHHGSWFYLKAKFKTFDHGIVSDWGEVVTR